MLVVVRQAQFSSLPIVVSIQDVKEVTGKVWTNLINNHNAIQAIVTGCAVCEEINSALCNLIIGYGRNPDENGETTLDSIIFDGKTMNMGAVAGMRFIKEASKVSRNILDSNLSILAGLEATKFAVNLKFRKQSLGNSDTLNTVNRWKTNYCQPNFWKDVEPNSSQQCGPYHPNKNDKKKNYIRTSNLIQHQDTMGIIAIDQNKDIAACASTNGANHKIAGSVGDIPIPGAGVYADNAVGAAVATGDGDKILQFLPTILAVEKMRENMSPEKAANLSITRIISAHPEFFGAVVAVNNEGKHGAACCGYKFFQYRVKNNETDRVINLNCHSVSIKTRKKIFWRRSYGLKSYPSGILFCLISVKTIYVIFNYYFSL